MHWIASTHGLPRGSEAPPASPLALGGAPQTPFTQPPLQQSSQRVTHPFVAQAVHAAPSARHAAAHFFVAGSQRPPQHSASAVQAAVMPLHVVFGRPQRDSPKASFTQRSSSFVRRQHPLCEPDPQTSPVGRQVEFAVSMRHVLSVGSQMPEQQSALIAQLSDWSLQSWGVHTPPKHPSEQQSCARVHATPSPRHASRHFLTPA